MQRMAALRGSPGSRFEPAADEGNLAFRGYGNRIGDVEPLAKGVADEDLP